MIGRKGGRSVDLPPLRGNLGHHALIGAVGKTDHSSSERRRFLCQRSTRPTPCSANNSLLWVASTATFCRSDSCILPWSFITAAVFALDRKRLPLIEPPPGAYALCPAWGWAGQGELSTQVSSLCHSVNLLPVCCNDSIAGKH